MPSPVSPVFHGKCGVVKQAGTYRSTGLLRWESGEGTVMGAWLGSQDTYEFSLNRNLAVNVGSVQEGFLAYLSPWLACDHRCQGELVWLVSQAWRGRPVEIAVTAGYVYKGRATTLSYNSRPEITNMPDTWDHLAPSPWAGQRNMGV